MKTKLFFYNGAIEKLESIITKKKVLLVVGKKSFIDSGANDYINKLNTLKYLIYSDFSVNPNYKDIKRGIEIVKKYKPEIIVGIGGGSVLDTAKLLSVLSLKNINLDDIILNNQKIERRNIDLCLIPTTAGSGSEATHFAVIYKGYNKFSIASNYLLPDYVILDPLLTMSLSMRQTSISAFDGISQAIESIWSINSTYKSRKYAIASLEIFNKYIVNVIKSPDNESRKNILYASHLAGKAINISKTTAPHALSYHFTIKYCIPHGYIVFLLLCDFIKYNSPNKMVKLKSQISKIKYKKRYNQILSAFNLDDEKLLQKRLKYFIRISKLPKNLTVLTKNKNCIINEVLNQVNLERLSNNPMNISEHDMIKILNKLF
jgi:alcohol dehydrogenase class IV